MRVSHVFLIAVATLVLGCPRPRSPELLSIELSPENGRITRGGTLDFVAVGVFADGSSRVVTNDVIWQVVDGFVASVDDGAPGRVRGLEVGATRVRAIKGEISRELAFSVVGGSVVRLEVGPPRPFVPVGLSVQLAVSAVKADGSVVDVTSRALYSPMGPGSGVSLQDSMPGAVTGTTPGTSELLISFDGVSTRVTVEVTAATIDSVALTPPSPSLASGTTLGLRAIATLSDARTLDVTEQSTWLSGAEQVVFVSMLPGERGALTARAPGIAEVSASLGGKSAATAVTVTDARLSRLELSPTAPTLAKGTQANLTAQAVFTDGTHQTVSAQGRWTSDASAVAQISTSGTVTAVDVGTATLRFEFQGRFATLPVTVTAAELTRLEVSPVTLTLAAGTAGQLTVTGRFSDGSTQDLTGAALYGSSHPAIAHVSNLAGLKGRVSALSGGDAQVDVSLGRHTTTARVTVTPATLVQLSLFPTPVSLPLGESAGITATGLFSDGSAQDVTRQAAWSSSASSIAQVDPVTGDVTGSGVGTATVRAALQGVEGTAGVVVSAAVLRRIEVTPPRPVLALGTTLALEATGIYSDGTTRTLTTQATCSSSAPSIAEASNAPGSEGLLRGLVVGHAQVTVTHQGLSAAVPVEVTAAVLQGLSASSTTLAVPLGLEEAIEVTGLYSDGSTLSLTEQASWTEADSAIATVSNAPGLRGRVLGVAVGETVVTATFSGRTVGVRVTVTAAQLRFLTLAPSALTLPAGRTQTFVATGTFSDSSTRDVTSSVSWSGTTPAISVSQAGVMNAVAPGQAEVVVSQGSVEARATVTVTDAELVSLGITPAQPSVPLGVPVDFVATGVFTDGSTRSLGSQATWASSNGAIASISNAAGSNGRATTLAPGDAVISVALPGFAASTTLTVTPAALATIELTPASTRIAVGTFASFQATGRFTDGTTEDLTALATWSVSDTAVASASNGGASRGRVDGLTAGQVSVRASYAGITGLAMLDVANVTLTTLSISPPAPSVPAGLTQQLTVLGTFSDGSSQDLTQVVSWSSSDAATVDVSGASPGLARALATGTATITASALGRSAAITFAVTTALLRGIDVTPASTSIARGLTEDLVATGRFSDGTTADVTAVVVWQSSDPSIASVSNAAPHGRVSAVSAGAAIITASASGFSATANVTVTAAVLQQLVVSPSSASMPRGLTTGFSVTGLFSDGSSADLTGQVTWTSSAPSIATVSNAPGTQGSVQALQVGSVTLTASQGARSGTAAITVTPAVLAALQLSPAAPVVPRGLARSLSAIGLYTDGTTQDLTGSATWSSSSPAVATVSNAMGTEGLVSALTQGASTITATYGGRAGSVVVTVSAAILQSIQLTPPAPSVPSGLTVQLTATGMYSDNSAQDVTSQVVWTSSNAANAVVSNASGSEGRVTGRAPGLVSLTATLDGVTGSTQLTVSHAVLQQLQLTPIAPSRPRGLQVQFTATGVFSDATTQDLTPHVTWSSTDSNVTSVSTASGSEGLALARNVGQATVVATMGSITGSTSFTVTPAQLQRVDVTPAAVSLPLGTVRQFQALGRYTDGTTQSLTSQASWSSSNGAVLDVSNTPGSIGLATTLSIGSAVVTMTFGAFTSTASVTINQAALASIELSPTAGSTPLGFTRQFMAIGYYTDSTTQVLTTQATWTSSDTAKALVSNAGASRGLMSTVATGTVTIEASFGGVTGSTTHTISAATLVTIDLTSAAPSVGVGLTVQFTATGNYSDGSTQDLTSSVTWTSLDTGIAQVSSASGSAGLASGMAAGSTTLRVQSGSVVATAPLTVTP
jgi:uncharacterized protein YjdB